MSATCDTSTPRKRVAVIQSSYVPWKGYFDIINSVDLFILYDDVQFSKNDFRNRNTIYPRGGLQWLTIPVKLSGRFGQRICDVEISDAGWAAKHLRSILEGYARAPFLASYRDWLRGLYESTSETRLSDVNHRFLTAICEQLGIATPIVWSMDYATEGAKGDRLLALLHSVGATDYVSGPKARAYLDVEAFRRAGVEVQFCDYSRYPEYPQLATPFEHHVSILDLLLNKGPETIQFMQSVKQGIVP